MQLTLNNYTYTTINISPVIHVNLLTVINSTILTISSTAWLKTSPLLSEDFYRTEPVGGRHHLCFDAICQDDAKAIGSFKNRRDILAWADVGTIKFLAGSPL